MSARVQNKVACRDRAIRTEIKLQNTKEKARTHLRDMISVYVFYIYATVCCTLLNCLCVYTAIRADGGGNPLTENRTNAKTEEHISGYENQKSMLILPK